MDIAAPLRWKTDDGVAGTEVSAIPTSGRIYFYDDEGPIARFDNIKSARWWVFRTTTGGHLRITRVEREDGKFAFIWPGRPGCIVCEGDVHEQCPEGLCRIVEARAVTHVRKAS